MAFLSKDQKGMLYSLLGFSLFAIGDLFIKFLADGGFKAVEIAFFLNLFYLPFLMILSPMIGGIRATLRTEKLWLHILRALLSVLTFMIVVNGFKELGLSLAYTLIFVAPFFAAFLSAIFLKQKIHIHRWISIIMGFIGVLVVLQPWSNELKPAALALLFAALLIAVNHLLARKIGEDEPLMAFSLFGVIVALQVFGVLNFWDGEAKIPNHQEWGYFAIIACFHIFGILLTSRAFAIADTAVVAQFHYVQLLWGTAFGVIIFATVPDLWTGIGALIIVLSGIYLIYRESVRNVNFTTGTTSHGTFEQD